MSERQKSGPSSDAAALRDFGSVAEISTHRPHVESFAHRHRAAYAAIVLHGQYTESSADGILKVGPGDVIVHPAFHHHANVFAGSSVAVLNLVLPLPVSLELPYACIRLEELPCTHEDIVYHPSASATAIAQLLDQLGTVAEPLANCDAIEFAWNRLREVPAPRVYRVAAEAGISTEHLVRSFRARYGMPPGEYRAEHRFHHAVRGLLAGKTAADVAFGSGYTDQSHMTRDFRRRVGTTPKQLGKQLSDTRIAHD